MAVVQLRRDQQPERRGLLPVPLERLPLRPGGHVLLGRRRGRQRPAPAFIPSSVLGCPAGHRRRHRHDQQRHVHSGRSALHATRTCSPHGTVVPLLPTQIAAEREPVRPRRCATSRDKSDAEWGFYYLRYHDKIPFIELRQRPVASPPIRSDSATSSSTARTTTCSASRSTPRSATGRSAPSSRTGRATAWPSTRPCRWPASTAAFCGAGHLSGLRRREEMAGAPDDHLPARAERRPGLAAARHSARPKARCCSRSRSTYYPNLDFSGSDAVPALRTTQLPTKISSGGTSFEFGVVYPHVLGIAGNLTPQIDFAYDISGISPNTIPFVKGRLAVTPSLNFEYLNKWRAQLAYTSFVGRRRQQPDARPRLLLVQRLVLVLTMNVRRRSPLQLPAAAGGACSPAR